MVPKSETLAPVFKTLSHKNSSNNIIQPQDLASMGQQFDNLNYQSHPKIFQNRSSIEKPDFYGHGQNH